MRIERLNLSGEPQKNLFVFTYILGNISRLEAGSNKFVFI